MEHPGSTPALFLQEPYLSQKLTVEKFKEFMKINNHEIEFESIDWGNADPLEFAAPDKTENLLK